MISTIIILVMGGIIFLGALMYLIFKVIKNKDATKKQYVFPILLMVFAVAFVIGYFISKKYGG